VKTLRRAPASLALALGLALLAGCPRHEDPAPPAVLVGQAAPGDSTRHLLGVERYDITVQRGSGARVELRDAQGRSLGTVSLSGSEAGDSTAVLVLANGSIATWRGFTLQDDADTLRLRSRLEAEGQALELDTLAGDDHQVRRVELSAAPGPLSGTDSSTLRGSGLDAVFVLYQDGQPASTADLEAWLPTTSLDRLLASPSARALFLVMMDPLLAQGLAAVDSSSTPAEPLVSGIHKTQECAGRSSLGDSSLVACTACVGAVLSLPATVGLGTMLALTSCTLCGGYVGASFSLNLQCTRSQQLARTPEQCQSFCSKARGSAYVASITADEHGCVCTCDATRCEERLRNRISYARGETLCSTNHCLANECVGEVQTCGNGLIESKEGCVAEQCDPGATPSGCPRGKSCVNCRCLTDPEPIPDEPDAGVEPPDAGVPDSPPDAGSATTCQHVTCDPDKVCTMCGSRPYCGPSGIWCCGGAPCEAGAACMTCGGIEMCVRPGTTCCSSPSGVYTCDPGLVCCGFGCRQSC
jgi:hypothetical protein